MTKVVVGMSGGVDSSVAAYLLKQQGYEVIGVTLQLWHDASEPPPTPEEEPGRDECEARRNCEILGIEHRTVFYKQAFQHYVQSNFIEEYLRGRTPNPCILCNRYIKFAALLDAADELGAEYIATGHYARIRRMSNGRLSVCNSATAAKDQTYVLYRLTQQQLGRTLMPIGDYEKEKVRAIASEIGLPSAKRPDSMDVCFAEEYAGGYAEFLTEAAPGRIPPPGRFVYKDGTDLGEHRGITHYTIGQRKHLGISLGRRAVVTGIDPGTNIVTIGEDSDAYSDELVCKEINLMSVSEEEFSIGTSLEVTGKIRYAHRGAPATITRTGEDEITCHFHEKVRAITPGQSAVFYDGDYVLGGGFICQ